MPKTIENTLEYLDTLLGRAGYKRTGNTPNSAVYFGHFRVVRLGKHVSMLWLSVEREKHQGFPPNGLAIMFAEIEEPGFDSKFRGYLTLLTKETE